MNPEISGVCPCQYGRDGVEGTNLFPEIFLPQRDSKQGQKNTKECVVRDLHIVQDNGDNDALRLIIMMMFMTVMRAMMISADVY